MWENRDHGSWATYGTWWATTLKNCFWKGLLPHCTERTISERAIGSVGTSGSAKIPEPSTVSRQSHKGDFCLRTPIVQFTVEAGAATLQPPKLNLEVREPTSHGGPVLPLRVA